MSTNTDFLQAYGVTRRNEGEWHGATGANQNDRGGETFKGVARKIWPNWAGWPIIDQLKKSPGFPGTAVNNPRLQQMVLEFYRIEFWDRIRLQELNFQPVRMELFDTAVNVGTGTAVRFLQQALNYLNRNQKSWPDLIVDGAIGPRTINAFNSRSRIDMVAVFNALNLIQGRHYLNLMERDPTQEDFFRGWMERVEMMRA